MIHFSWYAIAIIICFIYFRNNIYSYEHFRQIPSFLWVMSTISIPAQHVRLKRCHNMGLSNVEKNVFDKFSKVQDDTWNVFAPCGYTHVEKELDNHKYFTHKTNGWVLGIHGADQFAAKDRSWMALKTKFGRKKASIFMPLSWVTYDNNDMQHFYQYCKENPSDMFIMKKNIQQQKGLHIVKDLSEAVDAFNNGYVLIQRILRDPFIIDGRKVNLRIYVLVTCLKNRKCVYIYDDGFVYYSQSRYTSGKTKEEIITSGYIDRSVYNNNPLTLKDFKKFLSTYYGLTSVERLETHIRYVIENFMLAVEDQFCVKSKDSDVIFAQTFGIDIQPNRDMSDVKIIEWNKGPSLEIMDHSRDGPLKQKMIDDVFRTLKIVEDNESSGWNMVWKNTK